MAARASTRPRIAAFVLLVACATLLWAGQLRAKPSVSVSEPVPTQLGAWHGEPVPVDSRAIEILETSDVTLMEYRTQPEETPIWFARVSGFGNRAAFHPPELCYVGSHFEVLERGPLTVSVGGVPKQLMRLVITQKDEQFEAWYWFTANGRVTPSYYQQQAWLLWDAIRGKPMSGTLVRISTASDGSKKSADRLLAFVNAWDTAQ
ncbi:MAG: EpsI family protein [Candidatus Omnitrophica bacterium CG11_big_fil_rev_8_21_14_0_20_63_9]|nr:MAG: EpsI family protein [Candidatus Omnitrophica bacterium CG11_big_fil_rev_8_21_14_0_20_63_9]